MLWLKRLISKISKPEPPKPIAWSNTMGHPIVSYSSEDNWVYEDTGNPIDENRPCVKCQRFQTEEGHDPCIANLPQVKFACCGHGVRGGYLVFIDGKEKRYEPNQEDQMRRDALSKN